MTQRANEDGDSDDEDGPMVVDGMEDEAVQYNDDLRAQFPMAFGTAPSVGIPCAVHGADDSCMLFHRTHRSLTPQNGMKWHGMVLRVYAPQHAPPKYHTLREGLAAAALRGYPPVLSRWPEIHPQKYIQVMIIGLVVG